MSVVNIMRTFTASTSLSYRRSSAVVSTIPLYIDEEMQHADCPHGYQVIANMLY